MKKIRILYCLETIASGGVEQRRLLNVRWLDKEKYGVKIICTHAFGFVYEELKNEGVEIITVGGFSHPFHIEKYSKVIQIIKSFRPHIIHGAVFEGMSMATVGGVFGRVPVKIIEETSDPQTRSKKAIILQRLYSIFSDKVVAISPSVLKFLRENVKLKPKKVVLINNGVAIPEPNTSKELLKLRQDLNLEKEDFVIGAVGRVYDHIKRFSDLISAFSLLKQKNLKLLLVGTGPDLEKLKSQMSDLGLVDQCIPVGYQANPHKYYALMDAFCIPSVHEGFGLVAAEAMLHRLPVIATKVGGLQDIVIDGKTGFLVPPFSPDQIAEKLKILIEDPELRKSMGEKGYERAVVNYTADRYCQEVENLYLQLLKEKGLIS
ncbi:glycosyltransferase [Cecembia rubra]|uniref:Glycosyltransferase involved in cell wall biosynthesis n=1 Tax=Cecembia rubra TaxID=1485585 RepID=A0A2P8DVM5_9BACT|nr:glycosyltransferase [Cecembia rubra]PSL01255.1 glycosyltransferase involved in cell wall biosynthesis [Cecembia rubra]